MSSTVSACSLRIRAAIAGVLLAVAVAAGAAPASAGEWDDAWSTAALTNDLRAWEGLAPLEWDGYLADAAANWAADMAWNGRLAHNPNLPYQVEGWWVLGENVGYGRSVDSIHQAWVNSWYHYLNLVEDEYTHIGVGVAYDGYGAMNIVQVFAGF